MITYISCNTTADSVLFSEKAGFPPPEVKIQQHAFDKAPVKCQRPAEICPMREIVFATCKSHEKSKTNNTRRTATIVQEGLANDRNYGAMALKYSISYQQVRNWIKKYEKMGSECLEDRRGRRTGTHPSRTRKKSCVTKISHLNREKRDLQYPAEKLCKH
jgi:transposase-like protein